MPKIEIAPELNLFQQFKRLLDGSYDQDRISEHAYKMARIARVAKETGWTFEQIEYILHTKPGYVEELILFWDVQAADNRTKDDVISRKLGMIIDKLHDLEDKEFLPKHVTYNLGVITDEILKALDINWLGLPNKHDDKETSPENESVLSTLLRNLTAKKRVNNETNK